MISRNKFLFSLTMASLMMSAPGYADNSSPAAGESNTSGYSLNPKIEVRFSPGKVETRKIEAAASAGLSQSSASGDATTIQGEARVPLHFWGDSGEYFRRGMLLDPGVKVRMDVKKDGQARRTELDATGAALYRWQGSATHSLSKEEAEMDRAAESMRAGMDQIAAEYYNAINQQAKNENPIARTDANIKSQAKASEQLEKLLQTSPTLMAGIYRKYGCLRTDVNESSCKERGLNQVVKDLREKMDNPSGANTFVGILRDASAPYEAETSATGQVIFGRASYRYQDNKDMNTRQNGVLITPLELGGHAAFRINELVNVGLCASIKPAQILAGSTNNIGQISSSVEGCADLTVGQLPTVRDRASMTGYYDTSRNGDANNAAFIFSNALSVEKKIGPITPVITWSHEVQTSDRANQVNTNLFTAGAGF